jgi:hypothetical protein
MEVSDQLHTPPALPREEGLPVPNEERVQPCSKENGVVAVLTFCVAASPGILS